MKTKWSRKDKIPLTILETQTLRFSSYKYRKFKVKLWWVGARERRKRTLFLLLILSNKIFFSIYILSQRIVYWMHFQNIHSFTYQKTLLHTILLLVFEIAESLQCFLNITAGKITPHLKFVKFMLGTWNFIHKYKFPLPHPD